MYCKYCCKIMFFLLTVVMQGQLFQSCQRHAISTLALYVTHFHCSPSTEQFKKIQAYFWITLIFKCHNGDCGLFLIWGHKELRSSHLISRPSTQPQTGSSWIMNYSATVGKTGFLWQALGRGTDNAVWKLVCLWQYIFLSGPHRSEAPWRW